MKITKYHSSRKVVDFTYQSPDETLEGSPPALPTSEPGTGQVVFTVASGHIPTFSIQPYSNKWVGMLYGVAKTITAATISYRMKKNSVSVVTGTQAVSANNYFTLGCFFYDIAIADDLEIAFWSNQTDSTYNYKALQVQSTRYKPKIKNLFYQPLIITTAPHPALTSGNPAVNITQSLQCPIGVAQNISIGAVGLDTAARSSAQSYGIFQIYFGDIGLINTVQKLTSATEYPKYSRNYVPSQIIYRALNL